MNEALQKILVVERETPWEEEIDKARVERHGVVQFREEYAAASNAAGAEQR